MNVDLPVFKAVEEAFRDRLEVLRLSMHQARGNEDAYRTALAQYNAAVEDSAHEYDRLVKMKRAKKRGRAARGSK